MNSFNYLLPPLVLDRVVVVLVGDVLIVEDLVVDGRELLITGLLLLEGRELFQVGRLF